MVTLGFCDSKECEGWPEVEASPEAFGSWIVAIASEGRRWRRQRRRFICNRRELKLGFGNGEANEFSRSEASELSRRWGWVLVTVRTAKGHRKSNHRRIEGMRRVVIWSGYRCGYRRFGVGIGVGNGDGLFAIVASWSFAVEFNRWRLSSTATVVGVVVA